MHIKFSRNQGIPGYYSILPVYVMYKWLLIDFLDLKDRRDYVRSRLSALGKTLDERPYENQVGEHWKLYFLNL